MRVEATRRWAQTRTLYFTIFLNSIAAAIQGWDQTGEAATALLFVERFFHSDRWLTNKKGSNGANLSFPKSFGIEDSGDFCLPPERRALCDKNSWIVGLINALPYITIALA
jgi:hypothetical protein